MKNQEKFRPLQHLAMREICLEADRFLGGF